LGMTKVQVQVVKTGDADLVLRELSSLAQEGRRLEYLLHGLMFRLWSGCEQAQVASEWEAHGRMFQRKLHVLLTHADSLQVIVTLDGKPIKKYNYTRKSF